MAASSPPCHLRVGAWTVDPGANEFVRDGRAVRVEPKVMQVLLVLAGQPGAMVSRDTLLDEVWPDVVVTEDALSRAVSKLRHALGDDPRSPRYVETISKAGYRLIAPVAEITPVMEIAPAAPEALPTGTARPAPAARRAPRPLYARWLIVTGTLVVAAVLVSGVLGRGERPAAPVTRTLTHLPGIEAHPALSRDGQFLAFVAQRSEGAGSDLYVQGVDDPEPRRLTDTPEDERHPAWLPDGRLAFLRCEGLRCAAYTTAALGGSARRLAGPVLGPWGLSATPDGRGLVAIARTALHAPYRLVRIDTRTGAGRPLSSPPDGALGDLTPVVSPDGRWVAFVRHGAEGEEDLLVLPRDGGGEPRRVIHGEGPFDGHAWTADGRALVFSSHLGNTPSLWRVPVEGGTPVRLPLATVAVPRSPTIARDRLAFEIRTTHVYLHTVAPAPGAALVPVVATTGVNEQPTLSPGGDRIAFVSDRSGSLELWTDRLDRTDPVRLTHVEGARLGAPRWSPDGRTIVFEMQREGRAVLYRIAAEGGAISALTDGAGYDIGPRWSPDGRFVYFGSNRSGAWEVWRVRAAGGVPERLTHGGGYVGEPTPDGRDLLFTRSDRPGLWRQPLRGGPATRLDSTLAPADWGNWAATPSGVLLLERLDGGARLVRLEGASGRRTTVLDSLSGIPARAPALAATPDGRRLVLARVERAESALVLAEPFE